MEDTTIAAKFNLLYEETAAKLSSSSLDILAVLERLVPKRKRNRGFEDLGFSTVRGLSSVSRLSQQNERITISKALIASLARSVVDRTIAARVTPTILKRTKIWCGKLYGFLSDDLPDDYFFPNDFFVKDYRFVQALSVPCGAQVVDLEDGVGPKTAVSLAGRLGIAAAWDLYRASWFRIHTESRYLDEFNEEGWTQCYQEIAKLLLLHSKVRGMAATSWFYDPQLEAISPRLAYLSQLPLRFGAVRVAHGTTAFDIRSATATSSTRRALYEAGKFTPVCHSILWKREDMCRWAEAAAT